MKYTGTFLEPPLLQLRAEAIRQRRSWVRKSTVTAALAIGAVSLYATGALQSPQLLALLGGATLKGLTDQLAEVPAVQSVASNNLYFLLRLDQEGKKLLNLSERLRATTARR